MAYGVIGNTTVSGTVILGSSPGRPAPRSSSGLGRRPLTAVTRVQIPYGVQLKAGPPTTECGWGGPLFAAFQKSRGARRLASNSPNHSLTHRHLTSGRGMHRVGIAEHPAHIYPAFLRLSARGVLFSIRRQDEFRSMARSGVGDDAVEAGGEIN